MTIYNAPIDGITWQAVEDFLMQNVKEGAYLDYKVDWPKELERTIGGMANTLGGVILIGVDENTDGSPKQPPVGVQLERGLAERVTNIVLSNISPPVFPEVAVCPDAAQRRAIVVIRVPQSHQTPHAIMGNRRVYLRTGNRNNPEELASVLELEWLQAHRAKALALRNSMYQTAVDRSDFLMGYVTRPSPGARIAVPGSKPYLLLCASPYYPKSTLITPPLLRPITREIRVPDYYGTDREFPIANGQPRLLQDGVFLFGSMENESGKRFYYTEFSVFGQLFYRQSLGFKKDGDLLIRITEVMARLDQFMRVAKRYLSKLNYQGTVWYHLLMGSVASSKIIEWNRSEQWIETTAECHDEAVAVEATLTLADWDSQSESTIAEAAQKIAWAYDWEMPSGLVKDYLDKYRRV
jgi:hypothetical protein